MPKLKNHSGAAKRFRRTGSGKFKRQLRSTLTICKADHLSVRKLLPLL